MAISDLVRTVALARLLSPVDYGLMAMAGVVTGLASTYMDLGVSAAIIHKQDITEDQLSSLYWLNLFSGVIAFGTVWFASPLISAAFHEPRMLLLLKVVALTLLISPLGAQFSILLQKSLAFKKLTSYQVYSSIFGTIVAIAAAAAGFGVWSLVIFLLFGTVLNTALLLRIGFREFRPSMHFRYRDLRGFVGFGLFQIGERSANYLAERLDQVLIASLMGAKSVGFYNFAMSLATIPLARLNPILTRVSFPLFAMVQHDIERLRRGYLRLLRIVGTLNSPLLIGLAVTSRTVVPVVFGAKWTHAVPLVQILCFVVLSRGFGNPIGSLQLAKGRADLGFWWNVVLLALSVPAIYCGGKLEGATGVAFAVLMLQMVLNIPAYLFFVRPLIGHCALGYAKATLGSVLPAVAMAVVVALLAFIGRGIPLKLLFASELIVGCVAYVGFLKFSSPSLFREALEAAGVY
jgi:O-antigen/teichoic acid export membrane protein